MISPEINHRRSIRPKEYDYSSAGAYFVTVCTKDQSGKTISHYKILEKLDNEVGLK